MPPLGKRSNDNGGLSIDESPAVKITRANDESPNSAAKLAPFIHKLEHLLRNNRNVFWSEDGRYLVIDGIRSVEFSQELADVQLSNKHESFIRQMNTYGFRKEEYTPTPNALTRPIRYPAQLFAYFNPNFTRDFKDYTAVHNKGKRKPIQQERETVSALKIEVQAQRNELNKLHLKLVDEQAINRRQTEFLTQIATSIGSTSQGAVVANMIYKFLATEAKPAALLASTPSLKLDISESGINSSSMTPISRSLSPNSQILAPQNSVIPTNLNLDQNSSSSYLPPTPISNFQPLNVTIPPPVQVQPTNETQTIHVGGNTTTTVQQMNIDELLKNPVYAAVYLQTLFQNKTGNQ